MTRPTPPLPAGTPGSVALRLVLGTLATWRVTRLLVEEDGPGQVVLRLRGAVDRTPLVGLLDCFGCASVWVGAAVGVVVLGPRHGRGPAATTGSVISGVADVVVGGLALSGGAFVLQQLLDRDPQVDWLAEPAVDSPLVTLSPGSAPDETAG